MSLFNEFRSRLASFEPKPRTLILLAIPLILIRIAFMAFPSLWLAGALWLASGVKVFGWTSVLRRRSVPLHGAFLVGVGASANALVMLANGGAMPVFGMSTELNGGGWKHAEGGGHLLFLADRMSLAGFSPGDAMIGIGILFTLSFVAFRGVRALSARLRPAML